MEKTLITKIIKKPIGAAINELTSVLYKNWADFPICKKPMGDVAQYHKIYVEAKKDKYILIDEIEEEYGYKIDNEWLNELAFHTQIVIKKSKICYQHGRLLYTFLRNYLKQSDISNINILETGTARGFSSLCMAKALNDSNICGRIFTFDVLPHSIPIYWNCIDDTDGIKSRTELLKNYADLANKYIIFYQGDTKYELTKLYINRINFAFIDGMHNYEYVSNEVNYVIDKQNKGDIIFFDDYSDRLFPGVVKAVNDACKKNNYNMKVIKIDENRGYVLAVKSN